MRIRNILDYILTADPEFSGWRTELALWYIVNSWNESFGTPIPEQEVICFLRDERSGDLTDAQRAFARARRAEMERGLRDLLKELLLYGSMARSGYAGDFRSFQRRVHPPEVRQTLSAGL